MPPTTCRLDGCDLPVRATGLCSPHYQRTRKYGHPYALHMRGQRMTTAERIWPKFKREADGCWWWTAHLNNRGYGTFGAGGRGGTMMLAHRAMYELIVGPIPDGLVLDHLCRTPACVNPAHLEPVTQAENLRRWRVAAGLEPEHFTQKPAA